jgi:hypothetical protein
MNYYQHLQQTQDKHLEGSRRYREREQREIILQKRRTKRQLSLYCVLRAWFIAYRNSEDYEEMLQIFMARLQPRKPVYKKHR